MPVPGLGDFVSMHPVNREKDDPDPPADRLAGGRQLERRPMTSAPTSNLPGQGTHRPLISTQGWYWLVGIGLLFVALYRTYLWRMGLIALGEWGGDWSHALIVPLISGYFISQNRDKLIQIPRRVYGLGLVVLFVGMLFSAWCIYPIRNDMLLGYSMVFTLFGLVLFLLGPAMMRVLWFPIAYLALGVKVSDRIWSGIAGKLQLVAAQSATVVMQMVGVDASVSGSTIEITLMRGGEWMVEKLNVAEACSGLRMLMAFIALGAAIAYLVERAWWQRVTMLLLAVPIAVLVNIGRVTVMGFLTIVNKQMASGDFHLLVGMLMLIPAAGLFWLVGWVLDKMIIDEPDGTDPQAGGPVSPPPMAVSDTASEAETNGASAGGWSGDRIAKGLALGSVLMVLIGLEYGLFLAIARPNDLFGGVLSPAVAAVLLGVGMVAVVWGLWLIPKLTGPERAPGPSALGVIAGVLLAAVLGFNAVVRATQTVLIKEEVPIRLPLFNLPKQVGSWTQIREDPRLSAEMLDALGTRQYTSRLYRDTRGTGSGVTARLHVAYYTGTPDTVPHVPERCFIASGLEWIDKDLVPLELSGPGYRFEAGGWRSASQLNPQGVSIPSKSFDATCFTYASPQDPTRSSNVIYFFVANGKYLPTPDWVRAEAFDPTDRYSYYCKVEVGLYGVADPQAAAEHASDFLSVMLPEVMACLPDWGEVTSGRWPVETDGSSLE